MIKITLWDENGDDDEVEFPSKFEVCARCEGHGTHLNPSIGGYAYSAEEFNEAFDDEESRAAYFQRGGMYDVACEDCGGQRVVEVIDEARCTDAEVKAALERYTKQERDRARNDAEDRATMRGECGYSRDDY